MTITTLREARPLRTPVPWSHIGAFARGALAEQFEWLTDLPPMIRGVWNISERFRKVLFVILLLNGFIAALDTYLFLGTARLNDAIAGALIDHLTYRELILAILWPQPPLILGSKLLEFARDYLTAARISPQFLPHIMRLCLLNKCMPLPKGGGHVEGRKNAIVLAGSGAALAIVTTLSRDPAYAARGAIVLLTMAFYRRDLAALIVSGLVLEFCIQWAMNVHMKKKIARQNKANVALSSVGFRLFDGSHRHARDLRHFDGVAAAFIESTEHTGRRRMWFERSREYLKLLVPLGCMALLVPEVMQGKLDIGAFGFTLAWYLRSGDPVYVFFDVQQQVMNNREQLRWLGTLLPARMNFFRD